jgi:hypothetical protein
MYSKALTVTNYKRLQVSQDGELHDLLRSETFTHSALPKTLGHWFATLQPMPAIIWPCDHLC